jgi:hypothetical protein
LSTKFARYYLKRKTQIKRAGEVVEHFLIVGKTKECEHSYFSNLTDLFTSIPPKYSNSTFKTSIFSSDIIDRQDSYFSVTSKCQVPSNTLSFKKFNKFIVKSLSMSQINKHLIIVSNLLCSHRW